MTEQPQAGSAPRDLRARRREELRTHVAVVALDLFNRHGYDAVTVEDIAQAAEVSKRTLFRHFATKDEIVLGSTDRLEQALASSSIADLEARDMLHALESIYADMLEGMVADPVQLQAHRIVATSDRLREAAHARHLKMMDGIRQHLTGARDETGGLVGRLVIELSTSTLHAALTEWGTAAGPHDDGRRLVEMYKQARLRARELMR